MKKIVYITSLIEDESLGVWKKVLYQSRAMNANGIGVYILHRKKNSYQFSKIDDDMVYELFTVQAIYKENFIVKYKNLNDFFSFCINCIEKEKFNAVYIRSILPLLPNTLSFINKCKRYKLKVFWEIPTYPYRDELSWVRKNFLDKIFFNRLQKLVDYLVVISDGNIEGLLKEKVISISNGIDCDKYQKRNYSGPRKKDTLRLLCVANYNFWHGYDKLLIGLKNYYFSNQNIKIDIEVHFVGSNMQQIEKMAKNLGVKNRTNFRGSLFGKELDYIYDNMDIAVGSLAMFRIGFNKTAALKIREYNVRGIPYITGCEDVDIPYDYPYKYVFPNDDQPIDINKIFDFYINLPDLNYVADDMNRYAKEHLTWKNKMKFVNSLI